MISSNQKLNNILITGASSGIGEALAYDYAKQGRFLALSGRNTKRLEAVAKACRIFGAKVETKLVDVTDRDACQSWIAEVDTPHPLDLLIANAGISSGSGKRR